LRAFHGVVTLSLAAAATLRRMEEQRKADASTGGRVQAEPDMVRFCLLLSFLCATHKVIRPKNHIKTSTVNFMIEKK
jgi:hypothetical protein